MERRRMKMLPTIAVGFLVVAMAAALWQSAGGLDGKVQRAGVASSDGFILALTWQPAFCESRPQRPECESQNRNRFDAQNLSLHGLWPQPRNNIYCGVKAETIARDEETRWTRLPTLEISPEIRRELKQKMPGYQSGLHRHEWFKHGSCMPGQTTPETYFDLSLDLLDAFNKSQTAALLRANRGKHLTYEKLAGMVEKDFGKGAAKRFLLHCRPDGSRTLIRELRFSLAASIASGDTLANALRKGERVPKGCRGGVVDPVGLQ